MDKDTRAAIERRNERLHKGGHSPSTSSPSRTNETPVDTAADFTLQSGKKSKNDSRPPMSTPLLPLPADPRARAIAPHMKEFRSAALALRPLVGLSPEESTKFVEQLHNGSSSLFLPSLRPSPLVVPHSEQRESSLFVLPFVDSCVAVKAPPFLAHLPCPEESPCERAHDVFTDEQVQLVAREWPSSPSSECPLCGEVEDAVVSLPCGHGACRPCWFEHAKEVILEGTAPVPCISSECPSFLSIAQSSLILDDASVRVYADAVWAAIPKPEQGIRCSKCPALLEATGERWVECPSCSQSTCSSCETRSHFPLDCSAMQGFLDVIQDNFLCPYGSPSNIIRRLDLPRPFIHRTEECDCDEDMHVFFIESRPIRIACGCGAGIESNRKKFFGYRDFIECLQPRAKILDKFGFGPGELGIDYEADFGQWTEVVGEIEELGHACEMIIVSRNYGKWNRRSNGELDAGEIADLGQRIERAFFAIMGVILPGEQALFDARIGDVYKCNREYKEMADKLNRLPPVV